MPLTRTADGRPLFDGLVEINRPTRVQVIDTFVHRPTWPNLVPFSGVFTHLTQRVPSKVEQDGVRLPFAEQLAYAGTGNYVSRIPEIARYPDFVNHACQKMGWNLDDLDLYRIRFEYPLMETSILLRLEATTAG